jgi:hypothetical protein
MKIENLKYIFENIQEGTVLAFYRKGFFVQLVPFFTRESNNDIAPQHVAIAYEIKRTEKSCCFMLSEQGFHGGKYRPIEITKYGDLYFSQDPYFMKQNLIEMFFTGMTPDQARLGIQDAIQQVGKKYGYSRFILTAEFFEKIFPRSFQRKIFARLNKKESERLCSSHLVFNMNSTGRYNIPTDEAYSPNEVIKLKNVYTNV